MYPLSRRWCRQTFLPLYHAHARRLARRPSRRCLATCLLIGLLLFTLWLRFVPFRDPAWKVPRIYRRIYKAERALPQHDSSLPYPEGKNGRYLYVSNQLFGRGWNNAFQELYMLAHMAYLSNRAFVFRPYTWDRGYANYVDYNGRTIPARIPQSAVLSGPIVGGPFPPGDPAPRAVLEEYFQKACPRWKRRRFNIAEIQAGLGSAEGSEVLEKYVKVLLDVPDGCVELWGKHDHPFDWEVFGSTRTHSLWPSLSRSPIITHFSWSPTVSFALHTNADLLAPAFTHDPPQQTPDLIAIHIRRGDFIEHCHHFANWSSSFTGWATYPGLSDRFEVPPGGWWNETTPENRAIYMRHCWPDVETIVEKVSETRREWENERENAVHGRRLRRLYVMTNGQREWVAHLKQSILALGEWDIVSTSREMEYTIEQKYIAQSIDMAIAERAAVFIGNGFSSLSANVAMLRMARELPLSSTHFW